MKDKNAIEIGIEKFLKLNKYFISCIDVIEVYRLRILKVYVLIYLY